MFLILSNNIQIIHRKISGKARVHTGATLALHTTPNKFLGMGYSKQHQSGEGSSHTCDTEHMQYRAHRQWYVNIVPENVGDELLIKELALTTLLLMDVNNKVIKYPNKLQLGVSKTCLKKPQLNSRQQETG